MPTASNAAFTAATFEAELAALLNDLLASQGELMAVLNRKRNLLAAMDHEGLVGISGEEQRLIGALQDCAARRQALLSRAAAAGLPSGSIQTLTQAMPAANRGPLSRQAASASSRARLLHTQNLTNWIVIQRTLIHLSQLLEIIATGGRPRPTYGGTGASDSHGALLNQEV